MINEHSGLQPRQLTKHIPLNLPSIDGWKEVPIVENNQTLVPIGPFSKYPGIYTHAIYFGEYDDSPYPKGDYLHNLLTMFVREEVAEQLVEAQSFLPRRTHLIVFDAYRTVSTQHNLFIGYQKPLRLLHPDWTDEMLVSETSKYVSQPSQDPKRPSPHNTGGSIDVALYSLPSEVDEEVEDINEKLTKIEDKFESKERGVSYALEDRKASLLESSMRLLNFGTSFDYGGIEASLNFYEHLAMERLLSAEEHEILNTRRLLCSAMVEAGFAPYEHEWWHYNSVKSQMGAQFMGLDYAEYGAIELSKANKMHDNRRVIYWGGKEKRLNRETSLPQATVILPTA